MSVKQHRCLKQIVANPKPNTSRLITNPTALWMARYCVTPSRATPRLADHNPDGQPTPGWALRCLGKGSGFWGEGFAVADQHELNSHGMASAYYQQCLCL
ncbi:MAG: hypothetical protein WCY67_11665 [Acidithiobacillus sp.]